MIFRSLATPLLGVATTVVFFTPAMAGNISGVVWQDLNRDGILDGGEPGFSGRQVRLDIAGDGTVDATVNTDAQGGFRFEDVPAGTHQLLTDAPPGTYQTAPIISDFQIDIVFTDSNMSESQRLVFYQAAARWSQLIIADLPDVQLNPETLIDDLLIEASAPEIDGPSGILGQAGPRGIRSEDPRLPATGVMEFDIADIDDLEQAGELDEVILHEMGHVLGIGTIWSNQNLLSGAGSDDPRFLGTQATVEYNGIFSNTEASVPVANQGGPGTRDSHWRESTFDNELMTGILNSGQENPLSVVTVDSLADLGYEVNPALADPYGAPARKSLQPGRQEHFCRVLHLKPQLLDVVAPNTSARRSRPQRQLAQSNGVAIAEVILPGAGSSAMVNFGFATPPPTPTPTPTPPPPCPGNTVGDPSFESGGSNTPWADGSTLFGSVFCSDDVCGSTDGPRTGDHFLWFGGADALESGFAQQDVVLTEDLTELRFYLWIPIAQGSQTDFLRLLIDDTVVAEFVLADAGLDVFSDGYVEVAIALQDFADGETHTIRFESTVSGQGFTNFFVDDVATCANDLVREEIFIVH